MIVGLAFLAALLVLRSAHGNRHVRGRLLASAVVAGIYALIDTALRYATLSPPVVVQFTLALPLLMSFAVINAAVALAINPWRIDRLPDRFPTIVQDTIVIALFTLTATLILQERIFATTAVGAVVVGLALQDTLGNLFAGLAIQIEKPFRVGQWVNIGGKDGMVTEVTWRATKIRTKLGNFVIVPNNVIAKETITNYSEPTDETRIEVDLDASYDTPPNDVKAVILEAIKDEPLILKSHAPEVLVFNFAASGITYRVRVWTHDFASDEIIRERLRSAVYYAFRRARIVIPYPVQVQLYKEDMRVGAPDPAVAETALRPVPIFSSLSNEQWTELARTASLRLYAAHEAIVRQGEAGSSMFVVSRGGVSVRLASGQEVARLGPGDFFGEMSLLTGAPRTATVTATLDSELVEIAAEDFRRFVMENPMAVEQISAAVSVRAAKLEEHRAAGLAAAAPAETPQTFLARVRRFLRVAAG
jgi:small-conductance mechanosensitive channel/CRP-like cAMP-binding protein